MPIQETTCGNCGHVTNEDPPSPYCPNCDGDNLKRTAEVKLERAQILYAVGLAVDDGVMEPEEASEFLELESSLERVQSDLYPGDEYFDQAMVELGL